MIHFKAWLLELLETDAQGIVQGMARPNQPRQPIATPTAPTWIKAKALQNGFGLRSGQDIAVAKLANGDWHYITLDQKRSKGTIPAISVSKTIQSYKDAAGQPMTAKSIDALMTPAPVAQQAKPQDAKSHVLSNEKMSEEQRAIDAQFERIINGSGSGHIMINALAGTGKTTMLKHLAWKYGNTKQKWLYLVFNTKNKVEASESFPPWVTVATTNGFLGGQDVLGSPANRRNIKATDRIVDINKHAGEDETAKKLEKARLLADGPEFDAMLNQMGIPSKEVGLKRMPQQQDRYGRRGASDAAANTVGSLLTSIRYLFKEQVLTLLGLAKSFAIDPRQDKLDDKFKTIFDKYDFDTGLEDVKERIEKRYSGTFAIVIKDALEQILGYDFMEKDYKKEILQAATWMMHATMPHATKQEYSRDRLKFDLGKYRDFNDDLWYAAIHADQIQWPHYDVVLADEVQDFNEAQKIVLGKLSKAGAKIVAVGDPNQCHPDGTLISLTGGRSLPIEEIKIGDEVVTYNTKKSYFPGTLSQGRKVLDIAARPYTGDMFTLTSASASLRCTPNHRCLVKITADNKYCLYLMSKGTTGRVGICRVNYENGFGVSIRANQEGAEKAWLLDVFDSLSDARVAECVTSARFGLPQLMFKNNGKCSADQSFINEVYEQIGDNTSNIQSCLHYFGKLIEYPIWTREQQERHGTLKQNYLGSKKSFVTQACNIVSGAMSIRVFDGSPRGGEWENVGVSKEFFDGIVHSLKVEPTEDNKRLYIADNVVVHNSIYRFRGADAGAFGNISNTLKDLSGGGDWKPFPLSKNYRSRPEVLDFANQNTHVKDLKAGKTFDDGKKGVTSRGDMKYTDTFDTLKREKQNGQMRETAYIARTNEPLVHAGLKLLANGIPFVIIGKDMSRDLLKQIDKVVNMSKLSENSHVSELHDRIQSNLDSELEYHGGSSAKKAYLQELSDTSQAIINAIEAFVQAEDGRPMQHSAGFNQRNTTNIGAFKKWLIANLSGLDVTENEKDLKKYQEKLKQNPVILTTAHKSKGLEFDRVYILRDDQFPHARAKRPEDLEQEANSKYVAYTRAKNEIHVLDLKGQPGVKEE